MRILNYSVKLFILLLILIIVGLYSLSSGSVSIDFADIISSFFGGNISEINSVILYDIRLPRILLAVAVGGGLSVAGSVFQAILMNPLAEPYILGVSSGGTFGAILSFVLGLSFVGTQIFAFLGAIAVIALVFTLGKRYGEMEPNILLLTGIMIGAFFSAAIFFLLTFLDESLKQAVFWIMGNLSLANSGSVLYVFPLTILVSVLLTMNGQKYNVLSLGDESAKHLGINSAQIKKYTYVITSLMVGALVSVSGVVGFVGLLIPHVCRLLFGIDNRIIIPSSFLLGASFLTLADTFARNIIAPSELPVGAITAIIGAPVFIVLLKNRFKAIS